MARHPRSKSSTDLYHVMLRGINKQQIFIDRFDRIQFTKILYEVIPIANYELHAYCLMGNHIHLLIKACDEPIELIMKRITIRFAGWYNNKYERHGHLFENRYKSEPIEDDRYYLAVIRYIVQNPVKAGLCESIFDYPWSSAQSYFNPNEQIINQGIRSYFDNTASLRSFLVQHNDDIFLENELNRTRQPSLTDEQAFSIFFSVTGCKNPYEFQALDSAKRKIFIVRLTNQLPVKLVAKYTGYTKPYIYHFRKSNQGGTDN